jgi:type I restriction enzyme M protein
VLFVQKYTPEQITRITKVQQDVAGACPDYEAQIKALLEKHQDDPDVPDDAIPEAIIDLIVENLSEPERETAEEEANAEKEAEEAGEDELPADEDRVAQAEEKINTLKSALLNVKQRLMDLDSNFEVLKQQQKTEIEVITEQWEGAKGELRAHLKESKEDHKAVLKRLKEKKKPKQKVLKDEIKHLEREIPLVEYELKILSTRGKLELILSDADWIGMLKERWIAAEVAKQLDYSIFMAVSERGGKNNSGDYEYMLDEDGSLVEFPDGHPQEGQLVVDQDLVNYNLTSEDLVDAAGIPDDKLCIAEAFVRFAQEQGFDFWRTD